MSKIENNPVARWIDDQISTGKMLELLSIGRGPADDLAGMIRNEYEERIQKLLQEIKRLRDLRLEWATEAKQLSKDQDQAIELNAVNLYLKLEFSIREMFNVNKLSSKIECPTEAELKAGRTKDGMPCGVAERIE